MLATRDVHAEINQATQQVNRDQAGGLALLNELFGRGLPPSPALDGRYRGALLTTSLNPILDWVNRTLFGWWLPWKGKIFDAAEQTGDNMFTNDGLPLARLVFLGYRGYVADGAGRSRALQFRTYVGSGRDDPDIQVLKIDYDLDVNPGFIVRDVLDELVQVDEGYYLGKAHLRWGGGWRCAAYFTLEK